MPPRGYTNLTVRTETRERLERLMREKGLANLNDAVAYLLDAHHRCERLEEKLQAITERLGELETLQRKTYLAVLRLLEEHTGRTSGEGPESPGAPGRGEDEHGMSGPVKSVLAADPVKPTGPRGREPQDIQQATGE